MFAAEKHFINVIRPQPSSSPFLSFLLSSSLPFPFAFCFHFFSHLLVISLSLFPSVFRSVSFSLRISTHFLPPSLSLSLPLSLSFISLSSSFVFSSFVDLLSVRFCFPSADLFLFSQRCAGREYFLAFARWVWYRSGRVSFKRETVGRNDDAVDDAVCGDSSSSRKRTWYILPSGQMCALLGSSGIINDTHRFL